MPQQPSILLIEDEANLRHNLGVLLEGEGYRVISAEDGAEGIRKLQEELFDLVITDGSGTVPGAVWLVRSGGADSPRKDVATLARVHDGAVAAQT